MGRPISYAPEVRGRCGLCWPIRVSTVHSGLRSVRSPRRWGARLRPCDRWVRQSERDQGVRSGLTTEQLEEFKTLRQENRELRRAPRVVPPISLVLATWSDSYIGGLIDFRPTIRPQPLNPLALKK